jgi:cell wall-associated NlpC family hydrolase
LTGLAKARAALAAALSLALAACAGTPMKAGPEAQPQAAPAVSQPPYPSPVAPRDPRAVMVDRAVSMLGQPYRFGGAAPGGFDCSGLVAYAANGAGIPVPRTAAEQMRIGMPVARGAVQAGDLVFMHLAHKELHVGIAIDDELFVHAPSSGGRVRIDSLAAAPYAGGYLRARRIIAPP